MFVVMASTLKKNVPRPVSVKSKPRRKPGAKAKNSKEMKSPFGPIPERLEKALTVVSRSVRLVEKKLVEKKSDKSDVVVLGSSVIRSIEHTAESLLLKNAFSGLFGNKQYHFRISTSVLMSSSGAGSLNAVVTNITLGAIAQFSALSGVFSEYFIQGFHVHWEPVSQYGAPLAFLPATTLANVPLYMVGLQHQEPPYSSPDQMANHSSIAVHNTGRPFDYSWRNIEKSNVDTVYGTEDGGSASYQGWQNVANTNNYSGQMQFMAASGGVPLPASQVLGSFVVHYDTIWRIRT